MDPIKVFRIPSNDCSSELSIQKEFDVIIKCFKEVENPGKVNTKNKLHKITYLYKTSLCAPHKKVKQKMLNMWMRYIHNMIVLQQ